VHGGADIPDGLLEHAVRGGVGDHQGREVLGVGLGLGLGLAAALGFLDTSFKGVEDLESFLGLPVICAIPEIQTASEKKLLRRQNIVWTVILGAGFTTLTGGMLLLWWLGKIII